MLWFCSCLAHFPFPSGAAWARGLLSWARPERWVWLWHPSPSALGTVTGIALLGYLGMGSGVAWLGHLTQTWSCREQLTLCSCGVFLCSQSLCHDGWRCLSPHFILLDIHIFSWLHSSGHSNVVFVLSPAPAFLSCWSFPSFWTNPIVVLQEHWNCQLYPYKYLKKYSMSLKYVCYANLCLWDVNSGVLCPFETNQHALFAFFKMLCTGWPHKRTFKAQ